MKDPVLIKDVRIHQKELFSEQNLRNLRRLFIGKTTFDSWTEFKHIVYRLFLNPSEELIPIILESREKLGDRKHLLGAHVRCGGSLADSKEGVYWINKNGLSRVQFTFRKAIKHMNVQRKDITVYLATDSTAAEELLRKTMAVKIVTMKSFKRGHTTSTESDSIYQGAIIDMFLVAQASVIIHTHVSGFSEAIITMAGSHRDYILPFDKQVPSFCV